MQQNRQPQQNFIESRGNFISTDSFANKVSHLKELTCEIKGTMLSLIASLPIEELPVTRNEFQKLIIFVTESCEMVESTEIKPVN